MGRKNKHRGFERDGDWSDFEDFSYSKTQTLKLKPFGARTDSQKSAYEIVKKNTLTFLGGPAGTGKTLILCRVALECLEKGFIKKIVITRPNIEAGKSLGYMPGGVDEKMYHYLVPIYDNFEVFLGPEKFKQLIEEKVIECVPVGFMRGRSLHNTFLIVDEGQNLTREQLRMVLTRIGFDSNAGVTYDKDQIDIKREDSCVVDIENLFGYDEIGDYQFSTADIVRSKIVKTILQAYDDAKENRIK